MAVTETREVNCCLGRVRVGQGACQHTHPHQADCPSCPPVLSPERVDDLLDVGGGVRIEVLGHEVAGPRVKDLDHGGAVVCLWKSVE